MRISHSGFPPEYASRSIRARPAGLCADDDKRFLFVNLTEIEL
jgi:hypothetical protein